MTEKRSGKECHNRRGGGQISSYHYIHVNISSNIKFYLKYLFYEKFFVNFTFFQIESNRVWNR